MSGNFLESRRGSLYEFNILSKALLEIYINSVFIIVGGRGGVKIFFFRYHYEEEKYKNIEIL